MYRRWPLIISLGFFIVACAPPALLLHVGTQVNLQRFIWTGYRSMPGYQLLYSGLVFAWIRLNFTAWANLPYG